MSYWPDGAMTRDEVEARLQADSHWRIEWCEGGSLPAVTGTGSRLPEGVLERVPSRAKWRKIQRGLELDKTWMFVFGEDDAGSDGLYFHEGPM